MQSIESLKELIKQTLLKNEGELRLRENKEIVDYARGIGIDDRKLSKLIQEVDGTINWYYIKQQKKLLAEEKKGKRDLAKNGKDNDEKTKQANVSVKQIATKTADVQPDIITKKKPNIFTLKRIVLASCIALIYLAIIKGDATKEEKGTTMFSFVEVLEFRSKPNTETNANIIGQLFYGDSVKVLSIDSGWAHCVVADKKGYVAAEFLLDRQHFYELDAIFADRNARILTKYSYWRKGLLKYFTSRGIIGNLSPELQLEFYGHQLESDKWQIFASDNNYYNSILSVENPNSQYSSIGIIIKNINTDERKFLLLGFNPDTSPILLHEADAPKAGNIKSVYKTRKGYYKVKYVK